MSTSLSPSSSLDMLSPTSPSTRWASDSLSDEDEIVWSLSSSAMLSPPLNMSPLSEAADYVLVPRIDATATTTPPTPPPPPSTTSTTAAGVAADQVREREAPTSDDAIAVVAEEMAALSLGTTAADMLTAPVSDSVSVSPSVSVSVSASASGATPTKKKCRKNRRRAGTTAQGLGVAMPSASEPTKKRKKAKKVVAPPSSCPSSSVWSSTSSSSSYHSSSGGGQSRSESASASEFESASASASAAARAAPPPLSLPSVATKKSSDGFSLSSSSSSSCASFSSAAVATPQPQKLREKQPKKKKNKGVSGSPAHAQGHAPVAAAADVANVKEEEPISTGYHEAHKFMTTYLAHPPPPGNNGSALLMLQALILELGCLPGAAAAGKFAIPELPGSMRQAKLLLKSHVFINVRDYLAVREQGQAALQRVMHPNRRSLVREVRKGRRVPVQEVKKAGLNVLLVNTRL